MVVFTRINHKQQHKLMSNYMAKNCRFQAVEMKRTREKYFDFPVQPHINIFMTSRYFRFGRSNTHSKKISQAHTNLTTNGFCCCCCFFLDNLHIHNSKSYTIFRTLIYHSTVGFLKSVLILALTIMSLHIYNSENVSNRMKKSNQNQQQPQTTTTFPITLTTTNPTTVLRIKPNVKMY